MAIVAADWTVDRSTGDIRYIGNDHGGGSPSYATVIQFHRWLQDLADDASSSGDDELDITDFNPSSRSTDNIIRLLGSYNIDDNAAEHLYDGTIIQGTGGTEVYYDGIVNYGNSDVQIQIIQNGAVLTDDWWNFSGAGLNPDATQGISHRFMIKTRTAGADIDGRRLIGTCRRFGYTYNEFTINGTARGNNVLALTDSNDLNNESTEGTVSGWTTITNLTEGYIGLDVDNNSTLEYYYSQWDRDVYSINQFYERMKWLTRDGSASTLYGLGGELFRGITHQITYSSLTGTFDEANPVTFGNGATAQVLADNGTDTIWVQLLTGVAPSASDSITQSTPDAASATVATVTDRSALLTYPFIGQSTGSAIIGGYGVGIQVSDLTSADKVFDLGNQQVTPPNYVTFIVTGLVSTEDRVLVAPWDGVTNDSEGNPEIDYNQLSLNGTLNTDNITSVVVSTAIPTDTPATGHIRVVDDNGFYRRLHYSSWTGSTFTIDTTDGQEDFLTVNATTGNNVFIAYIDYLYDGTTSTDRFTSVFSTTRNLVVKVRDGGGSPIKEFISPASLGANGGSIAAIRTSDT
jgi:hypothetical protein